MDQIWAKAATDPRKPDTWQPEIYKPLKLTFGLNRAYFTLHFILLFSLEDNHFKWFLTVRAKYRSSHKTLIYVHVTIDKQDEIGGEKADKQTVRCSVKPSSSKKYLVRYVSDIYDMEQENLGTLLQS